MNEQTKQAIAVAKGIKECANAALLVLNVDPELRRRMSTVEELKETRAGGSDARQSMHDLVDALFDATDYLITEDIKAMENELWKAT